MFTEQFIAEFADAVADRVVARIGAAKSTTVSREYLTYDEVGQIIGRTKEGVRYLVKSGKLPICDESGRVPRIHINDVRAYMDSMKHWAA